VTPDSSGDDQPSWGEDLRFLSWWLLLLALAGCSLACSLVGSPGAALALAALLALTVRIEEATRP